MLTPAAALPSLGVDKSLGKVAGWSIGINKSLGGCLAAATYQDETTVWIGVNGEKGEAFLAFTNPKWKSIEVGRGYQLGLLASGRGKWKGQFYGVERENERGLFASDLKQGFVLDVARSAGIRVVFEQKIIAQLSLSGSSDAISAMLGCQKEILEAKAPGATPRPEPAAGGEAKPKGDSAKSGTGFFVSEKGHVLTNNHVIQGCTEINVARVGMPSTRAQIVASDATNDLAVLSTDFPQGTIPALGLRPRVGESIYVYGFPLSSMLATTGNFTVGNVTATAGLSDDTRHLQISAPVQPGNSGGPLIDQYGAVVGVIVSRIGDLYVAERTDALPQNINFAINTSGR